MSRKREWYDFRFESDKPITSMNSMERHYLWASGDSVDLTFMHGLMARLYIIA